MMDETRALILTFRKLCKWWDQQPGQSGAFIKGSQGRKDIAWQLRHLRCAKGRAELIKILLIKYGNSPA